MFYFTKPQFHLLLPGDHITRIYSWNCWECSNEQNSEQIRLIKSDQETVRTVWCFCYVTCHLSQVETKLKGMKESLCCYSKGRKVNIWCQQSVLCSRICHNLRTLSSSPLLYVRLTCMFNELMHDWWYECGVCMSVLCFGDGFMLCVAFPAWAFSYIFTENKIVYTLAWNLFIYLYLSKRCKERKTNRLTFKLPSFYN